MAAQLALGAALERGGGLRIRHAWAAAVPIVIVNYVAFRAQLRFWQDHLSRGDALLVSAALESVAVYLAWLAHRALLARDSALRLRLAAYGMALLIGVLNYSHYMRPGWKPTVAAVTFGAMSAISPWLWSAYSRRENRDALKADGLIEDHAARLGGTRWFWHAYRCVGVMWVATWENVTRPAEAIAAYESWKAVRKVERNARKAAQAPPSAPGPVAREPRSPRAARAPGLAAARETQIRELAEDLARGKVAWRGEDKLGRETGIGRRSARKALELARAMSNGDGHGGGD